MNIFEYHLKEIHNLILIKKDFLKLDKIENLGKINLEVPPEQFNFDLSCNIAMVLGTSNKLAPKKLAEKIRELFLDQIKNFSNVEIAGPGFLNIKLSKSALIENINSILKSNENYGSNKTNETYNIEFVSANPTGPMHVGHCRGAIYGDVLSNLLKFIELRTHEGAQWEIQKVAEACLQIATDIWPTTVGSYHEIKESL